MLLKFRLEINVVMDKESETTVIELARRHYTREGGVTVPERSGNPKAVPEEEFIEGIDDALLELLGNHPLLAEAGIEIERLACRQTASLPETARTGIGSLDSSVQPDFSEGVAETDQEEELDDFESGFYLCRWPNGDFSMVKADSRRGAIIELDEWAGAEPAWLVPMDECMIDFRLNDHAQIELLQVGEETTDFILERCYPSLHAVLSSEDAVGSGVGERMASAAETIRTAVEHERKRLWPIPRNGTPAKTEIGRELKKRLGTVGVVADHYVGIAAKEILRTKAGEKVKPS
jgi:hypothetical protein